MLVWSVRVCWTLFRVYVHQAVRAERDALRRQVRRGRETEKTGGPPSLSENTLKGQKEEEEGIPQLALLHEDTHPEKPDGDWRRRKQSSFNSPPPPPPAAHLPIAAMHAAVHGGSPRNLPVSLVLSFRLLYAPTASFVCFSWLAIFFFFVLRRITPTLPIGR